MCGVIRRYKRETFLKRSVGGSRISKQNMFGKNLNVVVLLQRRTKENEMRVAAIHLGRVNINKRRNTSRLLLFSICEFSLSAATDHVLPKWQPAATTKQFFLHARPASS